MVKCILYSVSALGLSLWLWDTAWGCRGVGLFLGDQCWVWQSPTSKIRGASFPLCHPAVYPLALDHVHSPREMTPVLIMATTYRILTNPFT